MLLVHKVRQKWTCYYCKKEIPKGAYCIGSDDHKYFKFCVDCAETKIDELVNGAKERTKEYVKEMRNLKRRVLRNRAKYHNNNAVCVMQAGTGV